MTSLLLLLCFGGSSAFNLGSTVARSDPLPPRSQRVVAPELFRNGSFAFATVTSGDKVGMDVSVTIAGRLHVDECRLSLRPDDHAESSIEVTSLRRLSGRKVVLAGRERNEKRKQGWLVALDVASCESLYLYSSLDLADADDHRLLTRETSDKFEIFLNGRSARAACSKSRVTFRSGRKELNCFEVDVDWSPALFVGAFSFSEDVVMVRAFDHSSGTYKLLVYNGAAYPYRQQLWLEVPRADERTQLVSSDLAVCWLLNPGVDRSAHCALVDRAGSLRLNRTVEFEVPVRLLAVASARAESSAELVLMAERIECGEGCDSVLVSKVENERIDHRAIRLDCSDGRRSVLDIRQIGWKGTVAVEYVCEATDRFVLRSVDIDDS